MPLVQEQGFRQSLSCWHDRVEDSSLLFWPVFSSLSSMSPVSVSSANSSPSLVVSTMQPVAHPARGNESSRRIGLILLFCFEVFMVELPGCVEADEPPAVVGGVESRVGLGCDLLLWLIVNVS